MWPNPQSIADIWSHLLKKSLMENFIFGQWLSPLRLMLISYRKKSIDLHYIPADDCMFELSNKEDKFIYGTKYSRMDQVKFVEDSL